MVSGRAAEGVRLTTRPLTTSPPRKQSAILTLSFSVALMSCVRITPVNSSPGGRGMPSTTDMATTAWSGERRVTVPRMSELGAGGCGRWRCMAGVWAGSSGRVPARLARSWPCLRYTPGATAGSVPVRTGTGWPGRRNVINNLSNQK